MSRVVAVIDFAHSGTTMVAGLLEILGVPMVGGQYKPMKWEDLEVIRALQNRDRFAALVEKRAESCDLWGFKYPGAWKFAAILEQVLTDAVYLAIFKDPVSVTARRFNSVSMSKLANTINAMKRGIDGMAATNLPIHLLFYHQATVAPRDFVCRLMGLTDVLPTPGQVDAAVAFIKPDTDPQRTYPAVRLG
jgi:hypothetical protein